MPDDKTRRLSLIGTCTIIPLALLLTFGSTFTSPKNLTAWHWAFVWFTFLLNAPAVLASWLFPRTSAYWIVANTAVSVTIAAGSAWQEHRGESILTALLMIAWQAVAVALFLWVPQLLFAGAILRHARKKALKLQVSHSRIPR